MDTIETLVYNKYAWTNATSMLYIEQPVGTGFSTGDPPAPANETDVAGDMYAFLQNFLQVFDHYAADRLYIFGESYAGMYVPGMARKIFLENEKLKLAAGDEANDSVLIPIALAGIALGNGWIDARVQGPATIDYAYWHGMLDEFTRNNLRKEWEHCISKFSGDNKNDSDDDEEPAPFHNFNVPDDCSMMTGTLMAAGKVAWSKKPGGPNTYDVTTWDPYPILQDISER
jgi:carboxypeptidase C (cathepsin A)